MPARLFVYFASIHVLPLYPFVHFIQIQFFYKYSIIIVIIYLHGIVDKKVTNYTPLFHAFCIVCDLPATFRYYLSTFFLSCNLS